MPTELSDAEWSLLLSRIERGGCTPFLGAGVNLGRLPLPGDIAFKWAEEGKYPLEDRWNFARVAQYMALERGPKWPREQLAVSLVEAKAGAVHERDDAVLALADLPFSTYITTAHDDLLVRALRTSTLERGGKEVPRRPRADFCRWHEFLRTRSLATVFDEDPNYIPTVEEPLVFHLYGQVAVAESLVLTEDDHFDLLVATARHPTLIPAPVQRALRGGPLLFIGHPIADWNFRVLLRSLCGGDFSGLQAGSISVHVAPAAEEDDVVRYLGKYFDKLHIKVFWGTPQEFLNELHDRWDRAQRT